MNNNENHKYQNQDLENTCFDTQDLTGVDFSRSNLKGATFKSSILKDANFSNSDIRGCDFSEATLIGANFENAKLGINERRFVDLLFNALGISALLGISSISSEAHVGIYIDDLSPTQSVSGLLLSAIFSLAGGMLFLFSLYRTWVNDSSELQILKATISFALLCISYLSLRQAIALLKKLSFTSFQNANLLGVRSKDVNLKNVNFSGASRDDVDLSGEAS